jgi:hypothetical protein
MSSSTEPNFQPWLIREYLEQVTAEEQAAADAAAAKAAADKAAADKAAADANQGEQNESEYAKRLRAEAAENRKKAEALQAQIDKINADREAATLAEMERNKEFEKIAAHEKAKAEAALAEAAAAKAQVAKIEEDYRNRERDTIRNRAIEAAAAKAGLIDPDDASKIDKRSIRWDENGQPVGLDEAFAKLKEAKPHYFKVEQQQQVSVQGFTRPPTPASPTNQAGPVDAYSLSDEEFERQYAQIGRYSRA